MERKSLRRVMTYLVGESKFKPFNPLVSALRTKRHMLALRRFWILWIRQQKAYLAEQVSPETLVK
jgi:hypothetical protein